MNVFFVIIFVLIYFNANAQFSEYRPVETINSNVNFDTTYYKSGAVWQVTPLVDGIISGEQIIYFEDGSIRSYIKYSNNKKNGPWIEYYDYGYYKTHGYYLNNARYGLWIENYYNKTMKSSGTYFPNINYLIVGVVDDKQFLYTKDSNFQVIDSTILTLELVSSLTKEYGDTNSHALAFPIEIHFKDKEWQYWDDQGKLIRVETWDKGVLISSISY